LGIAGENFRIPGNEKHVIIGERFEGEFRIVEGHSK
jgi:hypothetical protein